MAICEKHGKEWMDDEYDGPGDYCLACGEIIDNEPVAQAPATTNPFHAMNNPAPKADAGFVPEKDIIFLNIQLPSFQYEDRQTGTKCKGELTANQVNSFIDKARQNARSQRCKLFVSGSFSNIISEDYREVK